MYHENCDEERKNSHDRYTNNSEIIKKRTKERWLIDQTL